MSTELREKAVCTQAVGPVGLEPTTNGLKVPRTLLLGLRESRVARTTPAGRKLLRFW